jgi:exonuclease III
MMRICTFNMLYERHYAKYARVPLMPADELEQILRATLGDLCRRCDVVCLQECHYHSTTFAEVAASHHFLRANGNSGETVAIAYRRDRFDADEASLVVNSFINVRTGQREPKCALSVTLFDKANGGRPMRITSTHVPWDAVSVAPVFDQLADFTAARTNATIDAIVCGDFNLEERRGKDLLVAAFPFRPNRDGSTPPRGSLRPYVPPAVHLTRLTSCSPVVQSAHPPMRLTLLSRWSRPAWSQQPQKS